MLDLILRKIPKCNSIRSRPGWVEPEVWFRIVHVAGDGCHGTPVAAYRQQTVEIALGPKGAFENGNIGALTRRTPPDQVLSAVPPGRGNPKQPRVPKTPRVVELLRKATEWQVLLDIREGRQSGRNCPQGEDHPRPGDTDNGHVTAGTGDPGTNFGHARFIPATTDYRASSQPYRRHNPLPRSASGVPQVLDLKRWDSNLHGFPHHPLKVACLHRVCSPFGFR